ncbi:MAG: hypothetical protein OWQ54_08965 [Sulfolobaceae archaeon]|nr:hypothetical protein [Sulfolobaceae archaeon]
MKLSGLIIALGIALLSLALTSINATVTLTNTFTNSYSIYIPGTAIGTLQLSQNATNITTYLLVIHNGEREFVKLPATLYLSPGNWTLMPYNETYYQIVNKVENVTEKTNCGNVTVQKVIKVSVENVTNKLTSPVIVKVNIYRMYLVRDPGLIEVIGISTLIIGIALFVVERFHS